jgi:hypothetical protein
MLVKSTNVSSIVKTHGEMPIVQLTVMSTVHVHSLSQTDGAWNCADVILVTEETMAYIDSNGDGQINLGDDIDN